MPTRKLPAQATPFIGRSEELAEMAALLAGHPDCRLLTLVGPGGIGKTRLAVEATRQSTFPDGVCFVPLQPLSSPDFIIPAIAEAIEFAFYPGSEPNQQFLDYLRNKSILFLLDNFEHLLEGADMVSEMLRYAPGVKVLATSRERLNLVEEWVFEVEGLSYPVGEGDFEIKDYAAAQLFVENARRAHLGFNLPPSQKPAVMRICQMVGGMPLALELASAWVRVLSIEQIATELKHSLNILETQARNMPSRHRTMRAALEPTWNQLSKVEHDVFKRLSVFRGGFTLEAAQVVAGTTLQTLSTLVDRSLVRPISTGRYDLHELLRQYGEEKLNTSPTENDDARNRHCTYFADFMSQQWTEMQGPNMNRALDAIAAEAKNVEAAWSFAASSEQRENLWPILSGLMYYDFVRMHFQEALTACAQAINALETGAAGDSEKELLGCIRTYHAFFCSETGLTDQVEASYRKGLAILNRADNHPVRRETVDAITVLAWTARELWPQEARHICQKSISLSRSHEYRYQLEWALMMLASIDLWVLEDYVEGKRVALEAFDLAQALGHSMGIACGCWFLGQLALQEERYAEAKRLQLESLRLWTELGGEQNKPTSLLYLGDIALREGKYAEARRWYRDGLMVKTDLTLQSLSAPPVLASIARLLVAEGTTELAVELSAFLLKFPTTAFFNPQGKAAQVLDELEATLPPATFAAAVERGTARNLENILKMLLTYLDTPFETKKGQLSTPVKLEHEVLTEREHEILTLVAQGLSNRQIAGQLILSVGTVKWYVSQICSKLHAENRVQALNRARELNLLS